MRFHFSVKTVVSIFLHSIAVSIILYAFLPIAKWYFFHRPILGVDFFNTATYARFLKDYFHVFPLGFKYFWFAGSPIDDDIILTWFIPFAAFAKVFPLIESIKISSLVFFCLLLLFVYLACFKLSKNQFVSALIAVLVAYSANMYGSLVWGGSLPYFANQLFFPLVLWLLAGYLQSGNKKWYWVSIIAVGASFLGHLSSGTAFVLIGAGFLLLFGTRVKHVHFFERIKEIVILFFISYYFAYKTASYFLGLFTQVLNTIFSNAGGGGAAKVGIGSNGISISGDSSLIAFERSHFWTLFSDTQTILLLLFGAAFVAFVLGFLFDRKKKNALGVLVWLMLAGYSTLHVFLNSYGISFLSQSWYRAFWHFPITLGLATAALFGYSYMAFESFSKKISIVVFVIFTFASIIVLGNVFFFQNYLQTIQILEKRSSPASAHPETINLVRNQQELEALKPKLVPSWLDPNDHMYRLFTSDAQVNVWWNALFAMPLVRGYIDPPLGTGVMGNQFLLDQSVAGDGLVTNFKYPEDLAKNIAMYYIDWYAVKYLEGGRLSKSPNKGPSSYLRDAIEESQDVEVKGAYILYQTKSGKPEVWEDVPQYLRYYQFKGELVTPILSGNNSPAIICFCDWAAYEGVIKNLSMNNINSQMLVTVFYDDKIDSIPLQDLSHFDGVIAINYKYGNRDKAFSNLLKYVENGGKLYIDTGTEVVESKDKNLPDIFPFKSSERKGLGKNWELSKTEDPIFENIDFEDFSPPLYNKSDWSFSYPTSDIDSSSQVLLKNHGKPILIRKNVGGGTMLWSGMNFSYHVHSYTNQSESKLFINLLKSLVSLSIHTVDLGKASFIDDRQVKFVPGNKPRGILFKEQFYDGWSAALNSKQVKAYKAGPIYPGFVYVPLDKDVKDPIIVEFTFWGRSYHYINRIVTLIIFLVLLDLILFDGKIFGKRVFIFSNQLRRKLGNWWKKEEE